MRASHAIALVILIVSAGCIFEPSTQTETTVTEVVDGDTIRVSADDGSVETIRVIGIDTPETRGAVSPTEFGLRDTEETRRCLRDVAGEATMYMQEATSSGKVALESDRATDNRGSFGRLLRYVETDNGDVGRMLVEQGYARVYEQSPFTRMSSYNEAASEARANDRGFWRCAQNEEPSGITISTIRADAAGDDRENLNDEYIVVTNNKNTTVSTEGWVLSDEAEHRYTFPKRMVEPNATVTVRTGTGQNNESTLHWNSSSPIWNNGGDTATITVDGRTVAERTYG